MAPCFFPVTYLVLVIDKSNDAVPLFTIEVEHAVAGTLAVSVYPFPLESAKQLSLSNLYQIYGTNITPELSRTTGYPLSVNDDPLGGITVNAAPLMVMATDPDRPHMAL